jgi:hypothetical protein
LAFSGKKDVEKEVFFVSNTLAYRKPERKLCPKKFYSFEFVVVVARPEVFID